MPITMPVNTAWNPAQVSISFSTPIPSLEILSWEGTEATQVTKWALFISVNASLWERKTRRQASCPGSLFMSLHLSNVHISQSFRCGFASPADNSPITAQLFLTHFCAFPFLLPHFADNVIKEAGVIKLFILNGFSKHLKATEIVMNVFKCLQFCSTSQWNWTTANCWDKGFGGQPFWL